MTATVAAIGVANVATKAINEGQTKKRKEEEYQIIRAEAEYKAAIEAQKVAEEEARQAEMTRIRDQHIC